MEKYEITKEQVLELHESNSKETRLLIGKMFPQAFQKELEVGKIYRDNEFKEHIFYVTKIENGRYYYYGFNVNGLYEENDWYSISDNASEKGFTEATPEEWKEAMTNELIRRYGENWENIPLKGELYKHSYLNQDLYGIEFNKNIIRNKNGIIFKDGIFAEVLDDQSELKERVEKMQNELNELKKLIK